MLHDPLLARFANEVALVNPGSVMQFEAALRAASTHPDMLRLLALAANEPAAQTDDGFWPPADDWRAQYRPYVVVNGILQVPVKGILLNEFPYACGSWATGYEYILRAVMRGMADPNVKGVALICNTPGGMVAGCFEMVDKLYAFRGQKPIRGYAHEMAASAGYAVISLADAKGITMSRTGMVGSVGVLVMHLDVSKAMDIAGYKPTYIFAGKHKIDGNPYESLPDDVKARIQARIDDIYGIFVACVARNRGMDEKAVRATEALTFTAPEAVSNGLADSIGPLDDAVSAFADDCCNDETEDGEDEMSKQEGTAALDFSAELAAAQTASLSAGKLEGAKAERTALVALLTSDVAKARPAATLAVLNTDMATDQIGAFLAALPDETKEAPAAVAPAPTNFDEAMNRSKNPNVGAPAEQSPEASKDSADGILGVVHAVGLAGFAPKKA